MVAINVVCTSYCSGQGMVWIGTNSDNESLNCSNSDQKCLTECYLKPDNTTLCNGTVYLKCG